MLQVFLGFSKFDSLTLSFSGGQCSEINTLAGTYIYFSRRETTVETIEILITHR